MMNWEINSVYYNALINMFTSTKMYKVITLINQINIVLQESAKLFQSLMILERLWSYTIKSIT